MPNKNYSNKTNSKIKNTAKKTVKKVVKKSPVLAIVLAIILIAVIIGGYFVYVNYIKKQDEPTAVSGELSFHFMSLGNKYNGDCIYVKAGDNDILIDGGSRASSLPTVKQYLSEYMGEDKTIEYLIVTHADEDHIAMLGAENGILDYYECKTIIDFAISNKTTQVYNRYLAKRDIEVENGAQHFTALQCVNNEGDAKKVYQLTDSVKMEILNNYYYSNSSTDENNYSVCTLFTHGDRNFLFTGDLEKDGEQKLVELNNLPQVELFKAGHHGSKTSSNEVLLSVIKPKICVVSCTTGTNEYTDNIKNQFPTQDFINRISKYTDKVYVTSVGKDDIMENKDELFSMNGDVVVISAENEVKVSCSESDTLLKDTAWFKEYRDTPIYWQ
ncbi:MAG: MBL fold metallo-hydrolase [Clostridia bacterium]|nr:MBL fold metallo-hydrolase [Clostridia bacterium]